ncbi:General transcription factor II-I repeat domain-containing protein 2, partial [Lamellibrachia satsuma]
KRTIDEECRAFNESWAIKYFFVEFKSKPMCVICNEIVSVKKEYNIKRHYDTKHAKTYGDYTGDRRAEKSQHCEGALMKQQLVFTKRNTKAQNNVRASFEVSSLIASRLKPFTDGEFVKDCLLAVVDVVCPEKKSLFEATSLS